MPARPLPPPLAFLTAVLLLLPASGRADGVVVLPGLAEPQEWPSLIGDRGGVTLLYRTPGARVGAVHLDANGLPDAGPGFDPFPSPVTLTSEGPVRSLLLPDSALVLLTESSSGPDPVGVRWSYRPTSGFTRTYNAPFPMRAPVAVRGRNGRIVMLSKQAESGTFWTMRTAVLAANGSVVSARELPSTLQFFNSERMEGCTDGSGGLLAVVPYFDGVATGSKDFGMFRVQHDGSLPWGERVRPFILGARDQTELRVVSDGVGGLFAAWTDARAFVAGRSTDLYAIRMDSTGTRVPGWAFYGSIVCDGMGAQSDPRLCPDGQGGAWIVWWDRRSSLDGDLRYTRVLGNGRLATGFTLAGTVLCDAPGAQREHAVVGDGAGGCFVVWRDERSGDADLYAMHLLASGGPAPGWEANGRPVCIAPGVQDQPAIGNVLTGRAVIAWRDLRTGAAQLRTAILDAPGTLDAPERAPTGPRVRALGTGSRAVRVSLVGSGEAELEWWDVSGRRVGSARLAGPVADHVVPLGDDLASGLYFVRVRQGGAEDRTRVIVTR